MASTLWRRLLFGFALLLCIGPAAAAEPTYPQLTGRVVDTADLLSPADIPNSTRASRRSRTRAPTRSWS
jgi:hypothetical protein